MLFKKKKQPVEARLPDQGLSEGQLNTSSLTWAFMRTWATRELNTARKNNDSILKTEVETAFLRGRIRTLKDILDLPEHSARRGMRGG